jgi:hypothetical protein
MAIGIAALLALLVLAAILWGIQLSRSKGSRPKRERPQFSAKARAFYALVTVASHAATVGLVYLVVDNIRSGGFGGPGGADAVEGYYVRKDLMDSSMGSAWYFEPASATATYYAYWEPGTCDFSDAGSGPYSVVNGNLILAGVMQASLSGDGRSFELDEPGQWSGDGSEGVAGPNLTVMNGISGTYVKSDACSAS